MHISGGKAFRYQRHRYRRLPNNNNEIYERLVSTVRQDVVRSQKSQHETNEQNNCESAQVGNGRRKYSRREI